jgi:REP element-mobilizing transposase RayT
MVRFARVVALDVAHHITQRGNARRFILETDQERTVYLDLLQQGIQRYGVELIGYCLMSNHVHLVAVPQDQNALRRSLREAHGRFASYWNAVNHSSGHVWQGRYFSCPLDETHLWEALRYVELNPGEVVGTRCLSPSKIGGEYVCCHRIFRHRIFHPAKPAGGQRLRLVMIGVLTRHQDY